LTDPEIRTLDTRVVYRNRWMTVREDRIERADGSPGLYGVVEKPDFAVIAAVQDGWVHLVEQYRYPIGARRWELPQGTLETRPGADPREVARAELAEETGLVAGRMRHVGRLHEAYGYASQAFDLFLATDLTPGPARPEAEELGLVSRAFPVPQVCAMMRDGTITDAVTVASFGLLMLHGLLDAGGPCPPAPGA
jgi:ADP-ribose pyrophosphatase